MLKSWGFTTQGGVPLTIELMIPHAPEGDSEWIQLAVGSPNPVTLTDGDLEQLSTIAQQALAYDKG
jgi:hypothetical protein